MDYEAELAQEREYTARVQQILCAVIENTRDHAEFKSDTIRMILADAWDELRMKPTALSPRELEQLDIEVSRFAAQRDFAENRAKQYEKMVSEPFFARIDFTEEGESGVEKVVIGLYSLRDPAASDRLLVHDWRAPICGLYYDATPGPASFESPSGLIRGTLTLKRQYAMENGRLKFFVNTDYSIDDSMLLDILSGATSTHMRQIVSTIQSEQNQAIRHERAKVLSVTGGAGSGKTSVAMHRAAYLLYRHRDQLDAKHICVLSPTNAFIEYVSGVLPDLGEENTQAATLTKIEEAIIGRKVEPPVKQYDALLSETGALRRESVAWKAGPRLIALLDAAADRFREKGPAFSDVYLGKKLLFSRAEMTHMYQTESSILTPAQRVNRINVRLELRLEGLEKTLYGTYEKQLIDSYKNKDLEFATRMAVAQRLHPVRAQLKQMLTINLPMLYAASLKTAPKALREAALENAKAGLIWAEDAPGIAYLALKLGCARPDADILTLLVDEAQDYPDIALRLMALYFPRAGVTRLGDPNQRTLPGLPECHPENWGALLGQADAPHLTLTRGYRSTQEIAAYCAGFLPENAAVPQCVGRSGEAPTEEPFDIGRLRLRLGEWLGSGIARAAVITRTQKEAESIAARVKGSFLLTGDVNELEDAGVTVGCLNLMKGLEFDAVAVVWPMNVERTPDEGRRLYTACSRALHKLAVYDCGDYESEAARQ